MMVYLDSLNQGSITSKVSTPAPPSLPPAVPRVDRYLCPEMEEALEIWVAEGERLAEQKRNLMKELEGLRILEEHIEARKNMNSG